MPVGHFQEIKFYYTTEGLTQQEADEVLGKILTGFTQVLRDVEASQGWESGPHRLNVKRKEAQWYDWLDGKEVPGL